MLTAIFIAIAVGLVVWFFRRRRRVRASVAKLTAPALYVLMTDGRVSSFCLGERLDGGSVRVDGAEYASSMLTPVDNVSGVPGVVYLCAVAPLALTQHRALEQYRAAVIKGALFKSGGDLMETLRLVAAAAVIASALFVWWQTSAMVGMVGQVQATVERVEVWTQKPLVIAPKE